MTKVNDFYKGILDMDFSVMGIFPATRPELEDGYRAEVLGYIQSSNPLTKEIYNHPDFKDRQSEVGGTPIWTMVGGQGLTLISGGRAQKYISSITRKYHQFAMQLAALAREKADWKDNGDGSYRITPDGKTTTSNGMPIGRYAMPWSMDDGGDFDGTITDEVKFTH